MVVHLPLKRGNLPQIKKCCLRGYDESSASSNAVVIRRLLDFLSDYDSVFKSHLESNSVFKGISKTILNDILDLILIVCKQIFETEIINSDFLAVMMDETTNFSDISQVVLVFWQSCGKILGIF